MEGAPSPNGAAADSGAPCLPAGRLRCLDTSHAATCALCTPAPATEDEKLFQLKTADQERNGEKELRALLAATPEWRSKEEREALAQVLATSLPELATLLHNRDLARLRKPYALQLCRSWGYKSDLWARRGGPAVPRKRVTTPSASAPASQAVPKSARLLALPLVQAKKKARLAAPSPPPFAPHLDTLLHLMATYFRPTARRAAEGVAGIRAEAALRRNEHERALAASTVDVQGCLLDTFKMAHVLRLMRAGTEAQRQQVQFLLAAPGGGGGGGGYGGDEQPRIPLYDGPVDSSLRSLHTMFRAGEADMHRPGPVWQAWRVEFEAFLCESFSLFAHAHAAYAPFCVTADEQHVRAADAVLSLLCDFLEGCAEGLKHRQRWVSQLFPGPVPLDAPQLDEHELVLGPRMPFLTREAACNSVLQPVAAAGKALHPGGLGGILSPGPAAMEDGDIEFDSMDALDWLLASPDPNEPLGGMEEFAAGRA